MSLSDFTCLLAEEPMPSVVLCVIVVAIFVTAECNGVIAFARRVFMALYLVISLFYPAVYVIYPKGNIFAERVFNLYSPHIALLSLFIATISMMELLLPSSPAWRFMAGEEEGNNDGGEEQERRSKHEGYSERNPKANEEC